MDGTLVDTEPYWMEAELELAERYGGTWSHEQALQVVGFDLLVAARLGLRVVEVPVSHVAGPSGLRPWKYARDVLRWTATARREETGGL